MTLLPLLILLFGVVEQEEKEIQQRMEKEIQGTLKKMSSELFALLESQRSLALGFSRAPIVERFAKNSLTLPGKQYQNQAQLLSKYFFEYQAAIPSIQALRFIEPGGKSLVKVKEGKPIEPIFYDKNINRYYVADQSSKEFFQSAIQSNTEVDISNFELGQVTEDADFCPAMLRYSVLMRDGEKLLGILVLNIWGTRIDNIVEATLGGTSRNAYIVELSENKDRDGIYLYHKNTEQRFANQLGSHFRMSTNITESNWNKIKLSGETGVIMERDERIFFYQ
ncbi:MAG: cache domain-containing protein, partial [Gammaproteobacteria bacterium]|nr:cache domain-containing protein [Gammaproteobacteria bacterium]